MPKWSEGYQVAVGAGSWADSTALTDVNFSTYHEVIETGANAEVCGLWNLGDSPATVSKVVYAFEYSDSLTFSLQYSNDGSSWTTVTLMDAIILPECDYVQISSNKTLSVAAKYWRFSLRVSVDLCGTQKVKMEEFRLLDGSNVLLIEPGVTSGRRRTAQIL